MTQKEQENFLKNAILIVDHTKTALIALVDLDLQNKSLTFEQFLNKNQHEAYHLCYNRGKCCQCVPSYMLPSGRIIYPAQLELLYDKLSPKLACHGRIMKLRTLPPVCCSFAQTGISTNVLDISLARCILTNFCHEVFWYSCLQFKRKSLEDFLNSNKHTIYHLLNNNTSCCLCPSGFVFPCDRPQISQLEWNNMFSSLLLPCTNDRKRSYNGTTSICSVSATPGISIHHLDLKLQDVLLRYCCPLMKSVIDLVDIRNVRYGHVQEARMSDADYKKVFQEIENNLMPIASVCGNIGEVKQKLQDLQNRTFDETLFLQYQNSLLEHLRYVNDIQDSIDICCKEVKTSEGKLKKDFSKKISKLANEKTVEAVATEVKIRIPRKLDKYYMQNRRQQRNVQHSVAKLARQCYDKSKEIEQQIDSVVESIEELAIRIPEIVEKCIHEKGLTMLEIEHHSKENTFVTTSVVSSCVQLLKDNNVLVLTGRAGSGKSRNSLEILRQYKVEGYDVIKLTNLKDFEDSFKGDVETLILCEDIFAGLIMYLLKNSDIEILDRVHACVNLGKTKVIFTIRDIVKRSCKWVFSSYRLFYKSVEVDLCSKELELKLEEKKALFVGYCHVNNFQIVGLNEQENFKDEVILDDKVTVKLNLITLNQVIKTEPILGFPQTCCLFTGNRKFTRLGEAFFKHPSSCLTEEIENLRKSGKEFFSDKIKYSLLVYVLLNGDLLDKNQINSNQMSEIISSCYDYSPNSISEHNLYDAIDEMIGQYLIKGYCTNSYQFQHQTVFESVLISYSRINPELILSKLAFDFIREMVRLEGFQEKEGEIVMKIPVRYYPNLCKRIIHILQNEYCLKSQSLIQLLCDSEIMRENDVTFVEHLIDEAHIVLPLQDLKIIIAFQDESESVNFYLPVALLEHVIKQKNMTKSLFPLLEHTRSIFQNDSKNEIIQSCKASVLSVFVSAVVQEHSEDILSRILSMIKDFKLTRDNDEYFTKVVCSTPPTNKKLMIWLLENIGMEYLDRKALCFEICFRTWTNLLHLLTKDPSTSGIDLTYLIKELCSSGKYDIVKWLVEKINCSLISMDTNINGKKDENIHWLLENVDKSTFNMQTAINELCTSGTIQIVQWFMQNYKSVSVLDMQTVLNEACRAGNICVVTWLIKSTDKSLFDLNQAILAACLSKRNDLITLLVDSLDPLSFDMNILLRMCRKGHSGIVNQLLRIIRHFTLPEVIDCARKACEQEKLEIVQWLIKALNSNNYLKSNSLF
ncbi:unnamed protein product [Mytilus edulis]|uniref:Novel STAND NTPase 3 domain-containing protein n=1 Tax=Mytilus edulis TaxID=6550 RepID=A0A8S3RHJ9_MYTED|nr:unnamed protein product [Mytilus edulis]